MKKRICILLSVLLILPVITSFSIAVSADNTPTLNELLSLAQNADTFCYVLREPQWIYTEAGYENMKAWQSATYIGEEQILYPFNEYGEDYDYSQLTPTQNSIAKEFGVSEGFLLERPQIICYDDSYVTDNDLTLPLDSTYFYFSLPEQIKGTFYLIEFGQKYFTSIYCRNGFIIPDIAWINNTSYLGKNPHNPSGYTPDWESAKLLHYDTNSATLTLTVNFSDGYTNESYSGHTIHFQNTKLGWKISGGSYFELMYNGGPVTPPIETNVPSLDELLTLAKETDLFCLMMQYEFSGAATLNPYFIVTQFALEKGYIDADANVDDRIDLDMSDKLGSAFDSVPYYPCSQEMDTLEKWKEEVKQYFTWDMYGLVTTPEGIFNERIIEYNNRVYVFGMFDRYISPMWNTAKLISADEKNATISLMIEDVYSKDPFTIEFENTKNGWRISGGTYCDYAYKIYDQEITPPAQTGDSAVYALWIAGISLLALGALMYRKKKI